MASYNRVFLMGNLTRDPQVKHLPSQTMVAEFGLAVNRKYRTAAGEDKEEVAFVDCTAFGRPAEVLSEYATKGKPLFVEGRLKFDTWEDKTGGKRSKLTVVVENFQFLGQREQEDGGGEPPRRQATPNHRGPMEKSAGPMYRGGGKPNRDPAESPIGDEKQFEEADIPF